MLRVKDPNMSIEFDIKFKSKVFWEKFFFPFGITWTGATLIHVRHKWILWLILSWILNMNSIHYLINELKYHACLNGKFNWLKNWIYWMILLVLILQRGPVESILIAVLLYVWYIFYVIQTYH